MIYGRAFVFILRITTPYLCASFGRQSAAFFNVYCAFKSVEIHWTGNSLPPIVSRSRLPTDPLLAEIIYDGFLWYVYIYIAQCVVNFTTGLFVPNFIILWLRLWTSSLFPLVKAIHIGWTHCSRLEKTW